MSRFEMMIAVGIIVMTISFIGHGIEKRLIEIRNELRRK